MAFFVFFDLVKWDAFIVGIFRVVEKAEFGFVFVFLHQCVKHCMQGLNQSTMVTSHFFASQFGHSFWSEKCKVQRRELSYCKESVNWLHFSV